MIALLACIAVLALLYIASGYVQNCTAKAAIVLLLCLSLLAPIATQAQEPAGSVFASQCGDITSAKLYTAKSNFSRGYAIRDLAKLSTMAVAPGTWYGYESQTPFGGSYPAAGAWIAMILTETSCGEMQTWAWRNTDGSYLIFAMHNLSSNCDSNGNHCGNHAFSFYYTTASEWQRVTSK